MGIGAAALSGLEEQYGCLGVTSSKVSMTNSICTPPLLDGAISDLLFINLSVLG